MPSAAKTRRRWRRRRRPRGAAAAAAPTTECAASSSASRSCRASAGASCGPGHEVHKERWRFDECGSILSRHNLFEKVIDVPGGKSHQVHPNVATHEKLEKTQREGKLVALDREAEKIQVRVRFSTAPVVKNGENQRWTKHGETDWPGKQQGENVNEQDLDEEKKQVVPRLCEDLIAFQLRRKGRKEVQLEYELEAELSKEAHRGEQSPNLQLVDDQRKIKDDERRVQDPDLDQYGAGKEGGQSDSRQDGQALVPLFRCVLHGASLSIAGMLRTRLGRTLGTWAAAAKIA